MAVTISPTTEALQAIVDRINAGEAYTLPIRAEYSSFLVDPFEELTELRVDVVEESSTQMNDTIATENRTSHQLLVWVRSKVPSMNNADLDPLRLLLQQIWQQLNNWDSSDRRVTVWDANIATLELPVRAILKDMRLFAAAIVLRVEVATS